MILLDTNLVSEPWKPKPDPNVLAWIDAQAVETLYLSAVTVAELRFGIAAMPIGKRRNVLHERLEGDVLPVFAGRVLSFDLDASRAYAELMLKAKSAGKAINMADGYIAAIAAARGFFCRLARYGAVSGRWCPHHQPMGGRKVRWAGARFRAAKDRSVEWEQWSGVVK